MAGINWYYIMFVKPCKAPWAHRAHKHYPPFSITQLHMNKADLISKLHEELGITKADAERAMDTLLESIVDTLKSGREVSIAGLGIFSAKMREARTARNPRTGEAIDVPAMRVPKFRPAKALKEAVK